MAWKNGELFKLKKQNGRCWQACFSWDKYHWISTKEDEKEKAIEWCEKAIIKSGKASLSEHKTLFGNFAAGFFSEEDPLGYINRRTMMGRSSDKLLYAQRQGWLKNYIMPRFAGVAINDINVVMIEDWYIQLRGRDGKLLSTGTRVHILKTLKVILDEAVRLGVIPFNPCDKVQLIKVEYKEKSAFTEEELKLMFPDNTIQMIEIWGDVQIALYFSIAIDTGWRAGEILALCADNYYPEFRGIYSTKNINTAIGELKDTVKTASSGGYRFRIGLLSDRSIRLINTLPEANKNGFFFSKSGNPFGFLSHDTLLRKLKSVMKDVVHNDMWYSYGIHNFRHTFMTRIKSNMSKDMMLELMGHTGYRPEYDHSTAAQRFKEIEGARDKIPAIV